jgi:heme/copper-type cytochrome/quinol oxidase subunit 2
MKRNLLKIGIALMLIVALSGWHATHFAYADAKSEIQSGVNQANGGSPATNPEQTLGDTISTIVNLLSAAVGVLAVIMIIYAGFRYVTSGGASDKVTSAKNTIVYAVIGLIIVALAQLIVKFVLNKVT